MQPCIFLIRHATPDWGRTDIPYDIPPGPPLTTKGETEAVQLGYFVKNMGLGKIYFSPLERAKRTAGIISGITGIPVEEELGIAEWRKNESEEQLSQRFFPILEKVIAESIHVGPIGLVSHGGPIQLTLQALGLSPEIMESYRQRFDHGNPLPPAGAWKAEIINPPGQWALSLAFVPEETN